jgi:hypothetical protein
METKKAVTVGWFEIPVKDMKRAIRSQNPTCQRAKLLTASHALMISYTD